MEPSVLGERGGDYEKVAEVLARNYRQLRGTLCRSLTRRLDLTAAEFEELYQEAWREVVRRAQAGEHIRNYRAFVTGVMVNKWKMELRSRRRHPTVPLDSGREAPEARGPRREASAPPPEDQIGIQEKVRLALELIESLSDARRRQVLKLRFACGLSAGEVQRAMGVTERTYRRLLTEAMHDVDLKLELIEQGGWCADRREVIVAYTEGRANEHEAAQARRHLHSCPACRQTFARLRREPHQERRPVAMRASP